MRLRQLKEETGSGLVLTLMVLLVLTVLGITIGTLTIGSYRLSDANRDDTSAYFIAEAGAVAIYEDIQKTVLKSYEQHSTESSFYNSVSNIVASKNGKANLDFDKQMGSKPIATIRTDKKDPQNFVIHSTGEVDGKKRTVEKELKVNWVEKNSSSGLPETPANAALVTQGSIDISNGNMIGDVHTNSTGKGAIKITGWPDFRKADLYYPSKVKIESLITKPTNWSNDFDTYMARKEAIDFKPYTSLLNQMTIPTITKKLPIKEIEKHTVQDKNGNLYITNSVAKGYELKLESDVYIPEIESNSQRDFSINTGKTNKTILVDRFNIGGDIQVKGEGTLTLIIKDSFKVNSGGISFNEKEPTSKLTLIYLGDTELSLANNIKINGHLIVKKANVTSNSIPINGVFLSGGKKVDFSGGTANSKLMLIAPNALVSLRGSYSIYGTVIANQFEMSGGATLEYKEIDTSGFPFGSSGTTTNPKPEDIISSGVIIEE